MDTVCSGTLFHPADGSRLDIRSWTTIRRFLVKDQKQNRPNHPNLNGMIVQLFIYNILSHKQLKKLFIFAEGFCGRIPRKDFQCRRSICGRVPRKDFAEGCGRIQKNKRFFCWPIFAEGSLRKDSAEGFSMRNRHLWKDSAEGFCGRISEGSAEGSSRKEEN